MMRSGEVFVNEVKGKMPVSIVMELGATIGITPNFDTIVQGQVFKTTCRVKGVSGLGEGTTKKTAKHLAALSALKAILTADRHCHPEFNPLPYLHKDKAFSLISSLGSSLDTSSAEVPASKVQPRPPLSPEPEKTPVAVLQEFCMKLNLDSTPVYEEAVEVGEPHNRTFTIRVTLGKFSEVGESVTSLLIRVRG